MAAAPFYDDVFETSTTTGTGTITRDGAILGYQNFEDTVGIGNTTPMAIWGVDANGNRTGQWEVAKDCLVGSGTITRGTLLASSTGGVVSFSAGTKRVAQTLPAAMFGAWDGTTWSLPGQLKIAERAAIGGTSAMGGLYGNAVLDVEESVSGSDEINGIFARVTTVDGQATGIYPMGIVTGSGSAYGFVAEAYSQGVAATVGSLWGCWFLTDHGGSGVLGDATGIYIYPNSISGAGSIVDSRGILIEDQTAGNNNRAIKTGLGPVEFGDNLILNKPVRLKGYTVGTLPAATQGDSAFVTDALAPTFLATVVGGGAAVTPVFYNGSAWVGS